MKANFSYPRQWLRPFVSILLAFVGMVLALVVLFGLSYKARAAVPPYIALGGDSGTAAGENESKTSVVAADSGKLLLSFVPTDSTVRFEASGGVVIYEGSVLRVTQILTQVIVENISEDPVTVRVSWDGCDPYGTCPPGCVDCYLNPWVTPQERIHRPIKNHYSVQIWAWGSLGTLVDSCDLPVVPPSPTLSTPPIIPSARLAIYYGYPSLVNDCASDLDCATAAFAEFDLVVLGDGLEHPSPDEHTNTVTIVSNLEAGNTDVYGYIDLGVTTQNLDPITITTYVDEWAEMDVTGIFYDNAGQDFGVTRTRLISAVDYVHNHTETLLVFINAWEPDDVLSGTTPLMRGDWYLAESHPVSCSQCINLDSWWEKSQKLAQYRNQPGVRVATMSTGDDSDCIDWPNDPLFRQALWATYLFGFDAVGFTNCLYSASGPSQDRLCSLPPLPTNIGTVYPGPPTGPVTIDCVPTYSRPTDKGVIYVSGRDTCVGGDTCDGTFKFEVYLPIILHPIVLCEGDVLKVSQTESEIIVENISGNTITIRVSWDGCDPYGTCPPGCVDCYLNPWVAPGERVKLKFKDHTSVQVWAWGGTGDLVDFCNSPITSNR